MLILAFTLAKTVLRYLTQPTAGELFSESTQTRILIKSTFVRFV